ncbi:hypothetical protein ACWG0P_13325 [Amedibacillus sp. YH-ame6]
MGEEHMKIDIKENEKRLIGKFIQYERKRVYKKSKDSRFKVHEFIKNKEGNICSLQSYNKLKNGGIFKESQIYDDLLDNLKLKYNYDKDNYDLYNNMNHKISLMIESKEYSDDVIAPMIKELGNYDECVIEVIYLKVFEIIDSYLSERLYKDNDDIAFLLTVFDELNLRDKEVVAYVILKHHYNYDIDKIDSICEAIDFEKLKSDYNQMMLLAIYIRQMKFYKASILCDKLEKAYEIKNDKNKLIELYLNKLFIYMHVEQQEFIRLCNKIEPIIIKLGKQNKNYLDYYSYKGYYNYLKENYDESLRAFDKVIFHKDYFFPNIIFVYSIHTILNREVSDSYLLNNDIVCYDDTIKLLYGYYVLKYSNNKVPLLEDYLMKNRKNIIYNSYPSEVVAKLLLEEFKACCEKSGNKEKLYRFLH